MSFLNEIHSLLLTRSFVTSISHSNMNDVFFKDLLTAKSPTQTVSLGILPSFDNISGTDKTLKEVLRKSTSLDRKENFHLIFT